MHTLRPRACHSASARPAQGGRALRINTRRHARLRHGPCQGSHSAALDEHLDCLSSASLSLAHCSMQAALSPSPLSLPPPPEVRACLSAARGRGEGREHTTRIRTRPGGRRMGLGSESGTSSHPSCFAVCCRRTCATASVHLPSCSGSGSRSGIPQSVRAPTQGRAGRVDTPPPWDCALACR
jgi:hypothetical protein